MRPKQVYKLLKEKKSMKNKSIQVIQAVNKLEDTAIYCDQWVSAYCEKLGEIELHLSEVEQREVMICIKGKTCFVSLESITQENIRNFFENLVFNQEQANQSDK